MCRLSFDRTSDPCQAGSRVLGTGERRLPAALRIRLEQVHTVRVDPRVHSVTRRQHVDTPHSHSQQRQDLQHNVGDQDLLLVLVVAVEANEVNHRHCCSSHPQDVENGEGQLLPSALVLVGLLVGVSSDSYQAQSHETGQQTEDLGQVIDDVLVRDCFHRPIDAPYIHKEPSDGENACRVFCQQDFSDPKGQGAVDKENCHVDVVHEEGPPTKPISKQIVIKKINQIILLSMNLLQLADSVDLKPCADARQNAKN
mmetsp:Transcript_45394/g.89241  ORF Transcript_45394/g.89241 Transcript_45394/m.89241 type:complete len:255 (+) Transcript_45394:2798-3562(+)